MFQIHFRIFLDFGDNFWNNVVSTFPLVLPLCTDVLNFISSTGTEEPGSAVSLFTDPLFSFQRSTNARLKNKKKPRGIYGLSINSSAVEL